MRTLLATCLAAALVACAETGPRPEPVVETPDGAAPTQPVAAGDTRLLLPLPTLADSQFEGRLLAHPAGRYREEFGAWRARSELPATAGMVLSESAAGPPLTDPRDPRDVPDAFPAWRHIRPGAADLIASTNTLGRVLWRRARLGTATCVLFVQHWGGETAQSPASTLAGYYCAPPGDILTPGNAEAVVRAIGLRPAPAVLPIPSNPETPR